jgi:EpsI family protein
MRAGIAMAPIDSPPPPAAGLRAAIVMACLMAATALLAMFGMPVHKIAESRPRVQLEAVVPTAFGDWRLLQSGGVVIPNPQAAETLAQIYTQTLSRTYVHRSGAVVMLSIAYGEDQRSTMAVHFPEVCYPAQGFQVRSNRLDAVQTDIGTLPVRRLETRLGNQRLEPVTYWVTIGDRIALGGFERRLVELDYGLKRQIPDGLLFRVSSVNRDTEQANRQHDLFIRDLLQHVSPEGRRWLAGTVPASTTM